MAPRTTLGKAKHYPSGANNYPKQSRTYPATQVAQETTPPLGTTSGSTKTTVSNTRNYLVVSGTIARPRRTPCSASCPRQYQKPQTTPKTIPGNARNYPKQYQEPPKAAPGTTASGANNYPRKNKELTKQRQELPQAIRNYPATPAALGSTQVIPRPSQCFTRNNSTPYQNYRKQ